MKKQDAFLEALRSRLPEYMAQKRMVVGESGRKKIRCINPAHTDKTPSMSYHASSQQLHCFGCGVSYDIFDVIAMDYPECDTFPKQVRRACDIFGEEYPASLTREGKPPPRSEGKALPRSEGKSPLLRGQCALLHEGKLPSDFTEWVRENVQRQGFGGDYFTSRKISPALCQRFSLFELEDRAVLPIFSGGVCRCYCARALDEDTQPRYQNSPGAMELFGRDYLCGEGQGGALFLTEAIFDALSVEECGFHALSLCGAGNVQRFLTACSANPTAAGGYRFFTCGDADEAGQRMNAALTSGLSALGYACAVLPPPEGCKDLSEALVRAPISLTRALETAAKAEALAYAKTCTASAIPSFLDPERSLSRRPISTGFLGLDALLDGGLYPGLYIFGAISSLGKTSYLLQLADKIAQQGEDVLFFSLEMSARELLSKSLSRLSWQLDASASHQSAFTARELLRLEKPFSPVRQALFLKTAERYQSIGTQIFLREGVCDLGVGELRRAVQEHISLRGKKPVVIVDYLQILKPSDSRATDKQNTDRAVVELKRISRDFDLPLLAISSFNRENYRNCVSMEAFKESGAVEYSSDVLFGLQLSGAGEAGFDVNSAKLKTPRAVELVLLKNRFGLPFAKLSYAYFAKYSVFVERRGGSRSGPEREDFHGKRPKGSPAGGFPAEGF